MSNRTIGALACVGAVVLAGCAARGPVFSGVEMPSADRAQVVLYRSSTSLDGGVPWRVDVGGKKVAVLRNGGFAVVSLDPGTVEVELKANSILDAPFFRKATMPITLESGTRRYVKATVHLGAIIPPAYVGRSYTLEVVPEPVATAHLRDLKASE